MLEEVSEVQLGGNIAAVDSTVVLEDTYMVLYRQAVAVVAVIAVQAKCLPFCSLVSAKAPRL